MATTVALTITFNSFVMIKIFLISENHVYDELVSSFTSISNEPEKVKRTSEIHCRYIKEPKNV